MPPPVNERTDAPPREAADTSAIRFGIIGALRFPADELQFGRVLHSVCRSDVRCANAFCSAILTELVAATDPGQRARKLLDALGDKDVHSLSERDLFGASRGVLRARSKRQGRIDLSFEAAGGWQLGVELKFNDPAKSRQQDRYPRVGKPVAFVVRDPEELVAPNLDPLDAQHYLGAVAWESLLPHLRRLPVSSAEEGAWRDVLAVSEHYGDFRRVRPKHTDATRQDAEHLRRALPGIREGLTSALVRKHRTGGRRLAQSLVATGPSPGRTWAYLGLSPPEEHFLWIQLRHSGSSQPQLLISWNYRYPRVLRRDYDRLRLDTGFVQDSSNWWSWTGTIQPAAWRADPTQALVEVITAQLSALVKSGVVSRHADRS